MREKSRDLFDFGAILENDIFNKDELVNIFSQVDSKIILVDDIINFIKTKTESKDDEAVYLSENDRVDLSFEEIKQNVIKKLK